MTKIWESVKVNIATKIVVGVLLAIAGFVIAIWPPIQSLLSEVVLTHLPQSISLLLGIAFGLAGTALGLAAYLISLRRKSKNLIDDYDLDPILHYLVHKKTKQLYCHACLLKHNMKSELHAYDDYWVCTNCRFVYEHPDNKKKRGPGITIKRSDNWRSF